MRKHDDKSSRKFQAKIVHNVRDDFLNVKCMEGKC